MLIDLHVKEINRLQIKKLVIITSVWTQFSTNYILFLIKLLDHDYHLHYKLRSWSSSPRSGLNFMFLLIMYCEDSANKLNWLQLLKCLHLLNEPIFIKVRNKSFTHRPLHKWRLIWLTIPRIDGRSTLSGNISARLRFSKVLLFQFGAIYAIGLLREFKSTIVQDEW